MANFLSILGGAAQGFAAGGPYGALAGGAAAALGANSAAGQFGNGAMTVLNNGQENFQTQLYAEQLRHQRAMAIQSTAFDEMMDERSENMRQINTLRDVEMAQRKADNQITKKFIESINE